VKPEKRVRLEADQLEAAVLELMSLPQYAAITIARLAHELQQPLNAISDMVKKLCVRLEEGVNKGMYILRSEYKLAGDDVVDTTPMEMSTSAAAVSTVRPPPAASSMFAVKQEIKRER
jgi:hypothetical protein